MTEPTDGRPRGGGDSDDPAALERLGDRLEAGRGRAGLAPPPPARTSGAAAGDGLRIAIEFVVSVFVGAGLGYVLGLWLGGKVVGLLIGLGFGFAAGLRGVYRGMMAGASAPGGTDGTERNDGA